MIESKLKTYAYVCFMGGGSLPSNLFPIWFLCFHNHRVGLVRKHLVDPTRPPILDPARASPLPGKGLSTHSNPPSPLHKSVHLFFFGWKPDLVKEWMNCFFSWRCDNIVHGCVGFGIVHFGALVHFGTAGDFCSPPSRLIITLEPFFSLGGIFGNWDNQPVPLSMLCLDTIPQVVGAKSNE